MSFLSLERSSKLVGASCRSRETGGGGVGNIEGMGVGNWKGISLVIGFVKGVGSMADGELQMLDQRAFLEYRKRRSSIQHVVLLIDREG